MSDDLLTKEFVPCVVIDDGDDPYIEYCNEDTAVFYDRVDDSLELVRRMDDKKIIGARIYAKLSISTACGSRP